MDIGASTGGFTEVLLHHDASKVFCVDVGHGQLHERIAASPKIVNLERTHIRELTAHQVPEKVDGVVIDVSFISLERRHWRRPPVACGRCRACCRARVAAASREGLPLSSENK